MNQETKTDKIPHEADERAIVYVREADPEALPDHLKGATSKLFSVHSLEGTCIALTDNRKTAFALAKRNDMIPVSVH